MTRPLPPMRPCPCGCDRVGISFYGSSGCTVECLCHWEGPMRKTERGAILAWNRRSDAEAERRGAMAAVEWLAEEGFPSMNLRQAIERGEVLPGAKAKKGAKRT